MFWTYEQLFLVSWKAEFSFCMRTRRSRHFWSNFWHAQLPSTLPHSSPQPSPTARLPFPVRMLLRIPSVLRVGHSRGICKPLGALRENSSKIKWSDFRAQPRRSQTYFELLLFTKHFSYGLQSSVIGLKYFEIFSEICWRHFIFFYWTEFHFLKNLEKTVYHIDHSFYRILIGCFVVCVFLSSCRILFKLEYITLNTMLSWHGTK